MEITRGDMVTLWNGNTFRVKSKQVTLDSCSRPIVSVFTGRFYIPVDVWTIVAVNGVAVADMPQQMSLFP